MAPHWKCGSRQRVGGSNPPLSATRPCHERDAGVTARAFPEIVALDIGEFRFPDDEP